MYDPLKSKAKVVLYTAVVLVAGAGVASAAGWTSASYAMPVVDEAPQVSPDAVRPALDLSEAFRNLADAVTPAVGQRTDHPIEKGQAVEFEQCLVSAHSPGGAACGDHADDGARAFDRRHEEGKAS